MVILVRNLLKGRGETYKMCMSFFYCWQRQRESSAPLEQAAWICCAVIFKSQYIQNYSVFNFLSRDGYLLRELQTPVQAGSLAFKSSFALGDGWIQLKVWALPS